MLTEGGGGEGRDRVVATKDKSGWEGLVRGAGDERLGGGRSKRVGSG